MKLEKITIDLLKKFDACKEGIDFFKRNRLEGFPIELISQVKGDYKGFVWWIKQMGENEYEFGDNGNVLWIRDSEGNEYNYDENGNLVLEKDIDGNEYRCEYLYDDFGNILHKTDSEGNVWEYRYNEKGNKIWENSPGIQNSYIYDERDNLITIKYELYGDECQYEYDSNGNVTLEKYLEDECEYEYDSNGNVISTRTKGGIFCQWLYDKRGNLVMEKNEFGNIKTYKIEYYEDGQLKRYDKLEIPFFEKHI